MTDRRVADALLDVLEERGCLAGFISLRDIRRRAGVGVQTVRRAMARLLGWFVGVTDHEQNKNMGGALHYLLTFRADETQKIHIGESVGGCLICAKSPFSTHKATDPFNVGGNRDMRNAALCEVLGRAAVDVLVQLEGYDQPRRDALSDYKKACKEVATKGAEITKSDVDTLTRLADGLQSTPQPVSLRCEIHRCDLLRTPYHWIEIVDTFGTIADWEAGMDALKSVGAVIVESDTVCLSPNYSSSLGPLVASLGPAALLMIDAPVAHGDLTYEEFSQHTGLKYGTLHRAMRKLLNREIYQDDRDGMTKRFALRRDWLQETEARAHTMRTYGVQRKREMIDAKSIYDYCSHLLITAAPEQQPKLERRREQAFTRLMAAVALEAPALANKVDFAVAMRTANQNRPKRAPAMPEPGALAWYRLTELTGKQLLTADEYGELQALDKVLGAKVGSRHGQVDVRRAFTVRCCITDAAPVIPKRLFTMIEGMFTINARGSSFGATVVATVKERKAAAEAAHNAKLAAVRAALDGDGGGPGCDGSGGGQSRDGTGGGRNGNKPTNSASGPSR
jgi:hypothetical protein